MNGVTVQQAPGGSPFIPEPAGRLSLTTALPVPVADQSAQTTIYWALYKGNTYPWYNGTVFVQRTIAELSLALDSNAAHTGYQQSGKNFDLFLTNDAGTDRLVSGPAWTNDTTRAQAVSLQNGVYVNTASMTSKFDTSSSNLTVAAAQGTLVGTVRATANGQASDTARQRLLWNLYNRTPRKLLRQDTTDTWTYSTSSFQQANASTTNQVEVVRGLDEDAVLVQAVGAALNSTVTNRNVTVAVGLDSASAKAADCVNGLAGCTNAVRCYVNSMYSGFPGLGYHFLAWLEFGAGGDTQTWSGDGGGAFVQTGIGGVTMA